MASLVWNNRLDPTVDLINIHFNKIDECIKYINDDIADQNGNCERINGLVNQLEQLCQLQFMYEEQLLEGLKYPLVNDQINTHKLLLETFEQLKRESNQCHSPEFIREFFKVRLDLVSNMNSKTMKICDFIIDSYN